MNPDRQLSRLPLPSGVALLAAAYAVTGYAGLQVASAPGNVTAIWLPAGLGLAALVAGGRRLWPGITLGALVINAICYPGSFGTTVRILSSLAIALTSTLGIAATAGLVQRWLGPEALGAPRNVVRFAAAVALGCVVTATGGALTTWLVGGIGSDGVWDVWLTWWVGDAVGMLVVTPLVLGDGADRPRRPVEWGLSLLATLAASQVVFGRPFAYPAGVTYPVAWLLLPGAVWAGARLGGRALAAHALLIHLLVMWGTVGGRGPFSLHPLGVALLLLDGLLVVVIVTGLLLAASSAQVLRHRRSLEAARATLEARVAERTAELQALNEALREQVEARERLGQQLVEAQKQEALGRLAGGVAHDFNNLLTVVSAEADLLARDPTASADTRDSAAAIQGAAQRAGDLTRQLLAVARRQPAVPSYVDVGAALSEARRLLRPLFPAGVQLDVESGPSCGVLIDPTQFDQVVLNLALNARDALPDGGHVRLTYGLVTLGEAEAKEQGLAAGRWVRLDVQDDGEGIPPDVLPRIFEPFFTTKELGKGTGLGLSTAAGIASQAGGTVRVSSQPGSGTTFTVWLPAAAAPARAEAAPMVAADPAGRRLMVVEDDALVRRTLVQALQRAGYRTLVANDGEEALGLLRGAAESVDLVLTDVVMPRMGGIELVRALRSQGPRRVLFMSGFHQRQAELEGELFVPKPFSMDQLLASVRTALAADPR